jgi:hypothetical protein
LTTLMQRKTMLSKVVYQSLIHACGAALTKFTKYFDISSDLAIIATIIDPRLKLAYYEDGPRGNDSIFFKFFKGESAEDKSTRVSHHRQIFETFYNNKYRQTSPTSVHQPQLEDNLEKSFLPFFKKMRTEEPIKNEIDIYFR